MAGANTATTSYCSTTTTSDYSALPLRPPPHCRPESGELINGNGGSDHHFRYCRSVWERRPAKAFIKDWRICALIALVLLLLLGIIAQWVLRPILENYNGGAAHRPKYVVGQRFPTQPPPTRKGPPTLGNGMRKPPTTSFVIFNDRMDDNVHKQGGGEEVIATMENGSRFETAPTSMITSTAITTTATQESSSSASSSSSTEDDEALFWISPSKQTVTPSPTPTTDEDLKKIIDDLEDTFPPPTTSLSPPSSMTTTHHDQVIVPVEITIGYAEEPGEEDPTTSSQLLTSIEPVWRRAPPGETQESPPPPPPFVMSIKATKVNSAAMARKRREAPTIVTALLDIGRGSWQRFTRHLDQYVSYITNLLQLDNNMIIYCDKRVKALLSEHLDRVGDTDRIQVVEISLNDLPFYRWREEIQTIMKEEQENWQPEWDRSVKSHPEAIHPDYDILVNSKPYFLYNATRISKFHPTTPTTTTTSSNEDRRFFVWLDAGYGHGEPGVVPMGLWTPPLERGKITLLKLTSMLEKVERYQLKHLYRKQKTVISGGFLAGDVPAIKRFHVFFTKTFMDLLDDGRIDDDQTTLLVTIKHIPSTFKIIHGGWFDCFKLLPSQ